MRLIPFFSGAIGGKLATDRRQIRLTAVDLNR